MEPITQGLLGAAMGEVVAGRTLGRRAVLWGALVGMSPDLDVLLAPLHQGYGEWLYHRGTTHSLWFGFVAGPVLGWILWRWRGTSRGSETPLRPWIALAIAALVTHPILDGFTPYGTQLFAPFWRERFAWNGVGIIDPFYSVMLAVGVAVAASRRLPDATRRRWLQGSLVATSLYLVAGVAWNTHATAEVRTALEATGARIHRIDVYPTVLQPWLRHFVAHAEDRVFVGWHTPMADCPAWRERDMARHDPRVRRVLETWEGGLLDWFADGHVGSDARPSAGGGTTVMLDDLRYAWGTGDGRGMWGVMARFDSEGRLVGPVQRFSRQRGGDVDGLFDALSGRLPGRASGYATGPGCPVATGERVRLAHR